MKLFRARFELRSRTDLSGSEFIKVSMPEHLVSNCRPVILKKLRSALVELFDCKVTCADGTVRRKEKKR